MISGDGAFAAARNGELVVEVGPTDQPSVIFSGTKGLVAMCMLLLVERGQLELDAYVSRYWPEFSHRDVLVRHVVSHTAGLPGLRPSPTADDLLDAERMAARLAVEPPMWPAGEQLVYHALTYGWLCGELVPRVVPLERSPDWRPIGEPGPQLEALYGPMLHGFVWNEPAFHTAEIPAANAIGTARSIALLYARLDSILRPETIRLGRTELSRGICAVTGFPYAFGVGFELQTEFGSLGPPPDAFGHTGSGGGAHGAWPKEGIGFSYLPTLLRRSDEDDRARLALAAFYATLN